MFEPIIDGPGVISPLNDGPQDPYTGNELDICADVKFYYMYPKDPVQDTYKIATWKEACKIGEKEVSQISYPEQQCILKSQVSEANCRVWEDSSVKYQNNQCVKVYDLIHKDAYKVYFTIQTSCPGKTQIKLNYGILRVGEQVVFDLSSPDYKNNYVWGRLGARIPIYYDSISRFEDIEQEHSNTRTENNKQVPDYRTFFPQIQVYCVDKNGTRYSMKGGSYNEYTANKRDDRQTNVICTQPIYRRWYRNDNNKNEYYDHEGLGYVPTLTNSSDTGTSISLSHFEVEISFYNEYASVCVPTYTDFRLLYAQDSGDLIKLSHQTQHIDKFRYTHTTKITETVTVNGLDVQSTNTWWFFRAPGEEVPRYVLDNAFSKTTAKLVDLRVRKTSSPHSVSCEDTINQLGSGIFKESEKLQTVYIPKLVTYIPSQCFDTCKRLYQVYCYGNTESETSANKLINILTSKENLNSASTRLRSIGSDAFVDVGDTNNNILNASSVTTLFSSALRKSHFIAVIAPNLTSSNDGMDGGMMDFCCSEMHELRHFSKTSLLKLTDRRCYIDIPDNINTIHAGAFEDSTCCYNSLYAWKIPPSSADDKKYLEKWNDVYYTGVDITIPHNVTKICSKAFDFGKTGRANSGQIHIDPNKVFDTPAYRKFSPIDDVEYWAMNIEPNCKHHKLFYSGTCADYVKRISFEYYWIDRFWDFYCDNVLCSTVTISDSVNETVEGFDIRQSRPTGSGDDITNTESLFDWPIPMKYITGEDSNYKFALEHNKNTVGYIVNGSETIQFTPCIHSYAFQNCASVKTLILDRNPSIIIGEHTFNACSNLKSIESVNGGDLDTLLPNSFSYCVRLSPTQFNNLHVKSIHDYALYGIGGQNTDGSIGLEGGEENAAVFNSVEYIGHYGLLIYCSRHRCLDAVLKFNSSFVAKNYSISMIPWNTYHRQFGHSGGGWIYLTLTDPKFRRLHPFTKVNKLFDETMQNWFVSTYDKKTNYATSYNFYIFTESGDHLAGQSNTGNTLQKNQTTWCVPFKSRYDYYYKWKFLDFLNVLDAYAKSYS